MVMAGEGLRLRAVVVQLSPKPEDGDVYPSPGGGNKLALTKQGLLKVAEAKGIVWSDEHSRRVNDAPPCDACAAKAADQGRTITTCQHNVGFKAVGAWLDPAGRWRTTYATRYWLYDEERAEVERTYRRQIEKKTIRADQYDQKVEDEFNKRYHDRHALAETKAKNRVIREVGVKAAYSPQELQKSFLCVRVEPNITPEEAKRRALASGAEIFGGMAGENQARPALPAPDFDEPDELGDNGDDEDAIPAETSEVGNGDEESPDPWAESEPTREDVLEQVRALWGAAYNAHQAGTIKEMPPSAPAQDADLGELQKWCNNTAAFLAAAAQEDGAG